MSTKGHRDGGKFGSSHTTVIPAAEIIVDSVARQNEVTKILLGFIKAGLPAVSGHKRVKIIDSTGAIILAIRDTASHQEIRVFTRNPHATKLAVARAARDNDIHVSFGKDTA